MKNNLNFKYTILIDTYFFIPFLFLSIYIISKDIIRRYYIQKKSIYVLLQQNYEKPLPL
jgi:hypothetical protein